MTPQVKHAMSNCQFHFSR